MQVKGLLAIMKVEQKSLEERIKWDKRNMKNRNSIFTQQFYIYQPYSNKRRYDALEDAIQTIL